MNLKFCVVINTKMHLNVMYIDMNPYVTLTYILNLTVIFALFNLFFSIATTAFIIGTSNSTEMYPSVTYIL